MCLNCRLVGSVINSNREQRFRCADLALADFHIDASVLASYKDPLASTYLQPSLAHIQAKTGLRLIATTVSSDGSCLPHAVSRALVGLEMYVYSGDTNVCEMNRANMGHPAPDFSMPYVSTSSASCEKTLHGETSCCFFKKKLTSTSLCYQINQDGQGF